jgi:hypothetical protein
MRGRSAALALGSAAPLRYKHRTACQRSTQIRPNTEDRASICYLLRAGRARCRAERDCARQHVLNPDAGVSVVGAPAMIQIDRRPSRSYRADQERSRDPSQSETGERTMGPT